MASSDNSVGSQAPDNSLSPDTVAMEAPKVPAVIDQDDPDGLLHTNALSADLVVNFMEFVRGVGPGESDLVELGFMPAGADFSDRYKVDERWYPNTDVILFPQSFRVPRNSLLPGVYEVSVMVYRSGVNGIESDRKKLTIDTTPPDFGRKPQPVIFPVELGGTITETWLSEHGEVVVQVPWYSDIRAKDRAVYYWTDRDPPLDSETPIREQEFSQDDIDNRRLHITVYADEIRHWLSGPRYLYYSLRDRAGNPGPRSFLSRIDVDLTPAPGVLPPPRVPLSARGLVDRQQARDGVRVEIDRYDFPDASHWVAIFWDDVALDEFEVDPSAFPLKATVGWPTLHGKGDGPLRAKIYYKIRQGITYGPPSPDISVAVNLTLAGPDHTDAPALLNRGLLKVEVRGAISDIPDKLRTVDYGFDAKATLLLHDNPKPMELIELFWGSYPGAVDVYQVKYTDVSGQPIEFTIPWHVIDTDKQNPDLPVYYTTSNGVNKQQSLPTPVDVSIVLIEGLKDPTFPHQDRTGTLHCCAMPRLWNGVTVRIPADPRFEEGDTLTLVWQGCEGRNGTTPIAGAHDEITREILASDVGHYVDIVVTDYETLIAPMVNNGSGLAYYKLQKLDGSRGQSKADFVIINRTMGSGKICSPTNDICQEN